MDNVAAFQRVWLKPRILVDVKAVDTSCTLLGTPCKLPVYLSAVAMCVIALRRRGWPQHRGS